MTGDDGRFTFDLVPDSKEDWHKQFIAVVTVRRKDSAMWWTFFPCLPERPEDCETRHDIQLQLGKPATLAGTVVDEAGKPVAGAEIVPCLWRIIPPKIGRVFNGGTPSGRGVPLWVVPDLDWLQTALDGNGRFSLSSIPDDCRIDIMARAPGKAMVSTSDLRHDRWGQFKPGQADVRIVLLPESRIQGVVIQEETRNPLADVALIVLSDDDSPNREVRTDAEGRFEASGLAAGVHTIICDHNSTQPRGILEPVTVTLAVGEVKKGVVLELPRYATLEVCVRDPDGKPLERAWVGVSRNSKETIDVQSANGGVAAFQVPAGTWVLKQVEHDKYEQLGINRPVDLAKGETKRIEVAVQKLPSASGVVLGPDGKPVKGVSVLVFPYKRYNTGKTDQDGKFDVSWNPREFDVQLEPLLVLRNEAENLAASIPIRASGQDAPMTIRLEPGVTVEGAVLDVNRRPVSGASVTIAIKVNNEKGPHNWTWRIRTGSDGHYEVKALPRHLRCEIHASSVDAEGHVRAGTGAVDTTHAAEGRLEAPPIILQESAGPRFRGGG
jgi:protocatechuate 3,4-dioxygenase beta subunit